MTCIVGMINKDKDSVVIGADSAGVAGLELTLRKDEKVFKNNDFVIGCTSSFRMIQLLKYSFSPPRVYDKDVFEYMCTDFINSVRECFKEGGYLQKWEDGDDKGGTFLVGHKGRLFKVENDFQVSETIQGYDACGSGESYALGSIYNSKKKDVKNKILEALETASYFNAGVSAPFITYCT